MLRASIFQKNILSKSQISDFVESFNNCLVEIDSSRIKIQNENKILLDSSLIYKENDFNTTTYHGQFENNIPFRVIRPSDLSLQGVKQKFNCISAFTVGSINPDGYAVHFILTEPNDIRNTASVDKGTEEQIQRLLEGCVLALQNNLYDNFVDYTKRLLNLVDNSGQLSKYNYGNEITEIMKDNLKLFSEAERRKIK